MRACALRVARCALRAVCPPRELSALPHPAPAQKVRAAGVCTRRPSRGRARRTKTDARDHSFGRFIIAANSCHAAGKGETDPFCGKTWDICMQKHNGSVGILGKDGNCTLRKCLLPGCKEETKLFSKRPLYAMLHFLSNFWMRWVYTGITALRMMSKGLFLKDGSFFQSPWCLMDLIVVVLAWLNTPFVFGNLMFFMVLRGAKLVVESTHPWLSTLRIQMAAIGMGLYKIFIVFVLMNFILAFVSLLAMSLIGAKGDFHNRCAVPVTKNVGGNVSFVYEPLLPERPCRMNHLYSREVINCYSDVWTTDKKNFTPSSQRKDGLSKPGCQGTCAGKRFYNKKYLGTELNLDVVGVDNFGNAMVGDSVYCIGPDFAPLDRTQFPPSPQGIKNGKMTDYINANLTNWPSFGNNDPRNFDDIGHAAIVMYTIFYRNGWTGPTLPAMAIGGPAMMIAWIAIMVFVSYYLLNITVSITCSHYSQATDMEAEAAAARAAAAEDPKFDDDDDDGAVDDEEDDDDGELAIPKSTKDFLLAELQQEDYPWCGRGCDVLTLIGIGLTMLRDLLAGVISKAQPAVYNILRKPCNQVQDACGNLMKGSCHKFISCSIHLVFPSLETVKSIEEDEDEDTPPRYELGNSVMAKISVICMLGCMVSQGLQFSDIPDYKCACTDSQIRQLESYSTLASCNTLGQCVSQVNPALMNTNQTCVFGKCLDNSIQGYACYNPRFNHVAHTSNITGGLAQPFAESWMSSRKFWCTYGQLLHFVLYGWAFIFLLELEFRFVAHQGFLNFFTNVLDPEKPNRGPNFRNIVDTVCILCTVAGIVLSEFTFSHFSLSKFMDSQLLLAGVSFANPSGDSTGLPWVFKLLRLATIVRLAIRTGAIAKIPAVAVILRGFRGPDKVLLGIVMLLLVVFFSSLTAKELFDYGYSSMSNRFEMLSNFQDISSSMLPLMQIMCGSGWYEYAKAGTKSIGIAGFVFFCLYYFVIFFQFQRIFIAIIVQNFELDEDEKEMAQKMILEMKFEQVSYDDVARERFFGRKLPGYEYENFSFTSHYLKLLRGAKMSLRELVEYSEALASGNMGFSHSSEDALSGPQEDIQFLDEQDQDEDEDEEDKIRKQRIKIKNRLTINKLDLKKEALKDDDAKEPILTTISRLCRDIVDENPVWLALLLLVITASVVFAVYSNIDNATGIKGLNDLLSLVFLGFFFAEMTLKMIGYGIYGSGPSNKNITGYFNRAWCCVDFGLVMAQGFDVFTSLMPQVINLGDSAGILRGFRAVRSLRILVALKKIKKETNPLQMVMAALGASMPAIFTLLMAVMFVMFVYALVGMDQYAGLLSRCVTEDELDGTGTKCRLDSDCSPGFIGQCPYNGIGTYSYCTMDKQHCFGNKEMTPSIYTNTNWRSMKESDFKFLAPRQWKSTDLNFDNLYSSYYSVFSLINRNKLEEMLVQMLSVTGRDKAPVQNTAPLNAIFLFSLLLIVGIFVSQIVIGMIMTNLRLKSGLAFHKKDQLVWPATKDAISLLMTTYSPFVAKASTGEIEGDHHPFILILLKLRQKFRGIRDNWKFDLLISTTVAFNCTMLGTYYYDMNGARQNIYFWAGFACFCVYIFDAVVNLLADFTAYISVGRNQFDLLLTVLGALDLFLLPSTGLDLGVASLRMFRLMKILYKSVTFTRLMDTIVMSFPEAVATIAINMVVMFVFAALATNMFPLIKEGAAIDDTVNFGNFISSLVTIFRMSTGLWGDIIIDASVAQPLCTPGLWRPVDTNATSSASTGLNTERKANLLGMGSWKQSDLLGNIAIQSDCGQAFASYPVFLLFVFINNYILLPTFIASIIASYFKANLRDQSLIADKDLKAFQESWIDMGPEGNALIRKSYFTFKQSAKAPKASAPFDLSKFDSLIEMLDMKNCSLGFNKIMDPKKYKMAMDNLKRRGQKRGSSEFEKKFAVDYVSMCVMLLSIAEKARPVTIVDILRREKASKMLAMESVRKPPKKPKPKGEKQHAAINMPQKHLMDKKMDSLTDSQITYSYNLYVVLDQLARINSNAKSGETPVRLTPTELKGLKDLVDENDEDLLVYFEEYVEKSGPVYIESGQAFKAFLRFGKCAKDIFARSKKFKASSPAGGDQDGGDKDEDEDADQDDEDENGEQDEEDTGEKDEGDHVDGPNAIEIGFGEALEDEDGVLDLRNWSECVLCGEPVDNSWERCPTCGKKHPSASYVQ